MDSEKVFDSAGIRDDQFYFYARVPLNISKSSWHEGEEGPPH